MKDKLLSIGQLSDITGVSVKSIRHYCDINLIKPAYINSENNYRYFSEKQSEKVLLIKELRKLGFSLKKIEECFNNKEVDKFTQILLEKRKKVEEEINGLINVTKQIDQLVVITRNLLAANDSIGDYEVSILNIDKRYVVFKYNNTSYQANSFFEAYKNIYKIIDKDKFVSRNRMISIIHNNRKFSSEKTEISFCVEIEFPKNMSSPHVKTIEPGLYASITHKGSYEELRTKAYPFLFKWLEERGYAFENKSIEVYHVTRPISNVIGDFVTEIQIPIIDKQN